MRILDLDLDLFVNMPAYGGSEPRLPSDDYTPWAAGDVRDFLESQCGLRKDRPVPGRVVKHHHEAFFLWRDLIASGALTVPFEVVHVDSHADLGMGDAGWMYLMGDVLHWPVERRTQVQVGFAYMNAGNYLAYAAACRWISRLTYVHHPRGGDDLIAYHFKDFDKLSGIIELKCCDPNALKRLGRPASYENFGVSAREPEIPFHTIASSAFATTETFDFIVLAHSPHFTPVESDTLIPIFEEYLCAL